MGQELGEHHSQHPQEEKRHHRYTLLARIGLFLLVLSLGSWGVSTVFILSARNTPTAALTRIIPSIFFPVPGPSPPPCPLEVTPPGPLTFTIIQGQSGRAVQTVTLTPQPQPGCHPAETWSGNIVTYQGAHWLSISPTQGDVSSLQSVSIIVSSSSLTEGVYTGLITFTPKYGNSEEIKVAVDVARDRQHTSLGDIVAYTPLADLNILAKWPRLIKDHSVNMKISLLSSRNLPRNLLPAATPTTTQYASLSGSPSEVGFDDNGGDLLESAFGSQLISLVAQLDGTAFDISPSAPPPQDPNQRVVSFHWNILPKEAGPQAFEVNIAGQWENGGRLETTYFLHSEFSVNVDESPVPFITFGQVTLSALLLSLLGSLLNVPWILDYIQKRKETKQKQHAAPVSSKSTSSQPTGKRRRSHRGSHGRNRERKPGG